MEFQVKLDGNDKSKSDPIGAIGQLKEPHGPNWSQMKLEKVWWRLEKQNKEYGVGWSQVVKGE